MQCSRVWFASIACACLAGPSRAASAAITCGSQEAPIDLERVAGTKVRLEVPPGFTRSSAFTGYLNAETRCSIMVTEIAGPYAEVEPGFNDAKQLRRQGMRVLAREPRPMGEHPGTLIRVRQRAQGQRVQKWLWVFGNDEECVLVLGICPEDRVEEELDTLHAAVLSAVWDPELKLDPLEGLAFRIEDTQGMKLVGRMSSGVSYSPNGEPNTGENKPFFICAPGMAPADPDHRRFAERRMTQYPEQQVLEAGPQEPLAIDGLKGFSCVGTGKHDPSGEDQFVYQVMLFEGSSYWALTGFAPKADRERYLPVFQGMAASFARRSTTVTAVDGSSQIVTPATWTVLDSLNDDALIQVGHATAECFLIVLTDLKSDFDDGLTFEDLSSQTRAKLAEGASDEGSPRTTEIGGRGAIRCEFTIPDSGSELFFLHVTVDGVQRFHQIMMWCPASAVESSRADLERVLESFRERN